MLFYNFYMEALTGEPIEDEVLIADAPPQLPENSLNNPRQIASQADKLPSPKCKPAFSPKAKGGVFGFKK
jgi:hypothetical protein